ncbi:hypothetical protein O181_044123 [Austropuccinia psidii MF-1]|uniref:Manganese/iron superoxide dismutase C-terminal domain-containing protein n=1 Tax=Austropuccinia psidii MF-1 TaxID=1389203 RepID=A0A9Q3DMR8_9BASI|nr:hypothetical protein [Austropuccinia psidii MF-1]
MIRGLFRLNKPFSFNRSIIRSLHISPPSNSLPFSLEHGLSPFLSSNTLKSLAIDWQDGLLDRLNQHVKDTPVEHSNLFDTIVELSKDRTQVIPFNLASEALNNSFFLHGLKKAENDQVASRPSQSSLLYTNLEETYGSITQFISYFSNAAMGMSTSGYIWLVCDQDGSLGICATYGAGTILVQNREQRGDWPTAISSPRIGLDRFGRPLKKQEPDNLDGSQPMRPIQPSHDLQGSTDSNSRMFSTSSTHSASDSRSDSDALKQTSARPPVSFADSLFIDPASGTSSSSLQSTKTHSIQNRAITRKHTSSSEKFNHLHPLMNLLVAERAYLPDYGIWGKQLYLRNFWKCINWTKVEKAFESKAPQASHQSHSSIWNN